MSRGFVTGLLILLLLLTAGCSSNGSRTLFYPDHYTVRRGDTLYSIAWRFNLDHKELARWNGIGPPYTIYPGQRLVMQPGRARQTASATTNNTGSVSATAPTTTRSTSTPTRPQATTAQRAPRASTPPPTSTPSGPAPTAWLWPTEGEILRHYSEDSAGKKGIDIGGRVGQPVVATAAGTVVYSGSGLLGYGQLIIINHNKNYLSAYAHNSILLVKEGDVVEAGQKIAELGSTGTDRPMLHFEIRRDGKPVDPLRYLPRR